MRVTNVYFRTATIKRLKDMELIKFNYSIQTTLETFGNIFDNKHYKNVVIINSNAEQIHIYM